ncbi:MAG: CHAT domain-containing tetratricopeptide repeat protein [Cyanobacteria bacterium J06621_11]
MNNTFTPEAYKAFLEEVLQLVHDTNADPQVVYPLLSANSDKLDNRFAALLRRWSTVAFTQADSMIAQGLAATINDFSNLIRQFPEGERSSVLEIAIAGYEAVTIVATCEAFPQEWATTQENLANIYSDRMQGDRTGNLETAIEYYAAALDVFTREIFPESWARIYKNLGVVYLARIEGNQADNLETALRCYLASLEGYTKESSPAEWAELRNNLGLVYQQRIRGEAAENLEAAIHSYLLALQVYTREEFPWQWAIAQTNLGGVYKRRIRGRLKENQAAAIRCYLDALNMCTQEGLPEQWSLLQNNLGSLYYDYEQDETGENFETAIRYFSAALEVRTREAMPERWAEIQNNLGNIYLDRIQGNKAENLETAIRYYSAALEVYTRETLPEAWADTQGNLGISYRLRIKGDRVENLKQSIQCHLKPLEVYTRETFPQDWLITQNNLGIAYQAAGQLQNAYTAFEAAIDLVEALRGEIITGSGREEDKRKLAERWNLLYQRMVEVCLALAQVDWAIAYIERSKTRNLVDLILSRDLAIIFPPDVVSQLQQFQEEITSSQHQLQAAIAENPSDLAQRLQQLRQQRNDLQDRYLSVGSSFNLKQTQASLDEHTAIVQWFITRQGFYTFIITRSNPQPWVISHTAVELQALEDWSRRYWRLYYRENSQWWRNQLPQRLQHLAQILGLDTVLTQLPETVDQLILIPHRYLHLLPLHALPIKSRLGQGASLPRSNNHGDNVLSSANCLIDRFPKGVRYAPSCQLLKLSQRRRRLHFTHLLAVQNPTNDLAYSDIECEAIKGYFESVKALEQTAATKAAVNQCAVNPIHCAHFSCHGSFESTNPLESALQLTDGPLTLGEIFSLNLRHTRLVTLSACETGLTDPNSLSDEYIGLPSGFLYAGSLNVVSSLWSVGDVSTALLLGKFYENLQTHPSIAVALNQAQCWLRDASGNELKQWIERNQLSLNPTLAMDLRRRFKQEHPFQAPYHWAAFCAIGP